MTGLSVHRAFCTFTFIWLDENSAGTAFAGDILPMKDSGQECIHHRSPKSSGYSAEILLSWQMIYFIYFPWSSCIISILLILGKYIKKVINWQLWLCYGPQTAIIHYVSIINFTSNVFQQRLQKQRKKISMKPCTLVPGNPCFTPTWHFSDLSAISGLEEWK